MITREGIIVAAVAIGLGGSGVALAQANVADGSIQKIDQAAGKVTIKHGPIKNLDMDSMTMVFRVKDPEMLKKVKVGQKVKFEADRVDGQITVTKIDAAKK